MRTKILMTVILCLSSAIACSAGPAPRFEITYSASAGQGPITGRLILVLSTKDQPEPRLTVSPTGSAVFGIDINQLKPGENAVIDENSLGYPKSLSQLPAGDYYAQAIINIYNLVHRSDGKSIWVHMNDGRIETFNNAAGNIYSDTKRVHLGDGETFSLSISHIIPAAPQPVDSQWVKHVRIQSKMLTAFWGQPIYVHATVLLPKGYDEHPDARYPTIFTMGHSVPFSFNPDPERGRRGGGINPTTGLESGYDFYESWISDGFPRVIAISFEQQTPYFPDSYSINSVNNGPYGDAMTQEVIPYLEAHFRMIPKPYARIVEGASTGGWQTLGLQLHYPDFFGGAWDLQPDPIDFRHYQLVNIYKDENAFIVPTGSFTSSERPFQRTVEGQVTYTARDLSLFEAVLGSRGRSGYQFEAWEAVYGPMDADGYPRPVWDKLTGKIDHSVADYMRDHGYDLRSYAEQNWATLGPRITGKLHFFAGDMDNFYLNLAVYDFQDFLKHTSNPHYEAEFTFGRPEKGHGWHNWTWAQMVKDVGEYVKKNAPAGEPSTGWNY
jgi:hypothetical protein